MKTTLMFALAALLASPSVTALADTAKTAKTEKKAADTAEADAKGDRPKASPGWIIVEEDFWFPLRYEPFYSLDSIRYHYRRKEEKAAANRIDKAVSWLKLASSHAQPITKEKLDSAASELTTVAKDLRSGDITDAAKLDTALAKAAHALSEWHYYKAKESLGKSEAKDAGHNLELAARYLQHAADSAHHQFGPDTITVTEFYSPGIGTTTYPNENTLGAHLQSVQKAIKELGRTLEK